MFFSNSRGGYTPPRVFFVRVADKGLRLDAASRTARWFKVESLKLGREREEAESRQLTVGSSKSKRQRKRAEKDNAETLKAQRWRGDDGVVEKGQRLRFIRDGSTIVTICKYNSHV